MYDRISKQTKWDEEAKKNTRTHTKHKQRK